MCTRVCVCVYICKREKKKEKKKRQTDRQTDKQAGRQAGKQKQTDVNLDKKHFITDLVQVSLLVCVLISSISRRERAGGETDFLKDTARGEASCCVDLRLWDEGLQGWMMG